MIVSLYLVISLIGLYCLHQVSEIYSKKQTNIWFLNWLLVFVFFNSQQYSMLFDREVLPYWFFYLSEDSFTVNDYFVGSVTHPVLVAL
ncbi:hypothetical protein [Vibrio sp. VPAP30]|uniref:hypothetical protein n=1 Tax=Vibrio sp. VPAP30 TaxID=1647102 RepID=UPI000658D2B2|nr:hypothetical protein [Vibrio sp. VPAP30]KLN63491.1 hypothetical protein ZX61_18340 [Vibrio sp. VPAP30]